MECWIGVVQEADRLLVSLAGRLDETHVADLLRACAGVTRSVAIDMSDLRSVDAVGLDALHRLRTMGVRLIGVPAYIALALDAAGRSRPPAPKKPPKRRSSRRK